MSSFKSDTALLVIDVQNDYCHEDGGLSGASSSLPFYNPNLIQPMIPSLAELVDAARRSQVNVIWIRTEYGDWTTSESWLRRGEGRELRICRPNTWGAKWYSGLAPLENECVIIKHRYSPFVNAPLDTVLRAQNVQTLVITGVTTNVCVESTARDAFMRDYNVVVVSDCSATYDAAVHECSLQNIRRHFGTVLSAEEVTAAWAT